MVAMGRGTANMHHAHGTVFKLKHGGAGLSVPCLPEAGIFEGSAHGIDLCDLAAQEPAHQVDIMDTQIQENAAGGLGIAECFLYGRLWVHTGSLYQIGDADHPLLNLFLSIGIGFVISAHESQHEGPVGMALHSGFRQPALGHIHAQRLFAEHMLSRVQGSLDLPAVF